MKTPLVALGLVVILIIGLVWVKPWRHSESLTPEVATAPAQNTAALPAARAKKKLFFESPREPIATDKIAPSISPRCRELWTDIRKLNLGDSSIFQEDRYQVPDASQCQGLAEPFASLQKSFAEKCQPPKKVTDEKEKALNASNCQLAAFYYRAQITEYLTRDEDLSDISDMKVLTDKLFAKFMNDPKTAADVASRMLEIDPTYYPAAQTLLFSHMIAASDSARGNMNDPVWQTVRADLDRAKQMNPNDPQSAELDLFLLASQSDDPAKVRERAQAYADANPNSPLGLYYLAWAAYRSGNPDLGWQYLQSDLNKFPGEPRITATMQGVKQNPTFYQSPDRSHSPFRGSFSTNVNPSGSTY